MDFESSKIKRQDSEGQLLRLQWNTRKYINGIVQDCSISSVLAMEILQSSTKPLIFWLATKEADWRESLQWAVHLE